MKVEQLPGAEHVTEDGLGHIGNDNRTGPVRSPEMRGNLLTVGGIDLTRKLDNYRTGPLVHILSTLKYQALWPEALRVTAGRVAFYALEQRPANTALIMCARRAVRG